MINALSNGYKQLKCYKLNVQYYAYQNLLSSHAGCGQEANFQASGHDVLSCADDNNLHQK